MEKGVENYISHGYSDNSNKELAKQEACNTAKRELLAYVFGAAFQINQNMVKALGVLDISQDVSVNTGEIVLRTAMTETASVEGGTKCSITYPIQEGEIEKERLKSAHNKTIRFTEIGDPNNIRGGVLEVVTIPDDTDVLIDNVRWGTTPLRLNGKLRPGPHVIRLENINYKAVEESFIVTNKKTRIDKILSRATAKIKIITDPEGALVKINEDVVGHTPTEEIEVLAGQKIKIEVSHPEAETFIQNVNLISDEKKIINQKLLLKPGYISLNIVPNRKVVIKIDGIERSDLMANTWIQVYAGAHDLSIEAFGYGEKSISFEIKGGENIAIPTFDLNLMKEIEQKRLVREKLNNEKALKEKMAREKEEAETRETERDNHEQRRQKWKIGIYVRFSGSSIEQLNSDAMAGAQMTYQFSHYVGIETSLAKISGEKKYVDSTFKTTGNFYSLGLPILIWGPENNYNKDGIDYKLCFVPEIVKIEHTYSMEYISTMETVTGKKHSQSGTGASFNYSIFGTKTNESNVYFDMRLGLHQYKDVDGVHGTTPLSGGFTIGGTW